MDTPYEREIPVPTMKYLSPTSLRLFETDPERFVLQYILRTPRTKQSRAMAIGSAFDARVKGALEADLTGGANRWDLLYETQVTDPELREWCLLRSLIVFERYKASGAYAKMLVIGQKSSKALFEFDANGVVSCTILTTSGETVTIDVPIFGKPDAYFELPDIHVVLDWKVNGFAARAASPAQGYVELLNCDTGLSMGTYRGAMRTTCPKSGIVYNVNDQMKPDWRDQLLMYQWMILTANIPNPDGSAGEPIAIRDDHPWLCGIDQLVCAGESSMRVAIHRQSIIQHYKTEMRNRIGLAWWHIQQGWFFKGMPYQESRDRTQGLANMTDLDRYLATTRWGW